MRADQGFSGSYLGDSNRGDDVKIGVVGAGPGGLAAAVGLRHVGHDVEVLEKASTVRPLGAGLTLQVNAMRMLEALDLADAVRAAGRELRRAAVARPDGTTLAEVIGADVGSPGVAIHRGALSRVLVDALGADAIRLGCEVVGVSPDGQVELENGECVDYDVVVGADGIHSRVRTSRFGPVALRYSGATCWRGLAEHDGDGGLVERWGRGLRFGSVPLGHGTTYWFACATAPAGGRDGSDPLSELTQRFADFEPIVGELLKATPTILRHDLVDIAPLPRWTDGVVTLLGDAAHAMTPNLGQGAGQAIEDAVVLASVLTRNGPVEPALAAYEASRRPRATTFVRRSWAPWGGGPVGESTGLLPARLARRLDSEVGYEARCRTARRDRGSHPEALSSREDWLRSGDFRGSYGLCLGRVHDD